MAVGCNDAPRWGHTNIKQSSDSGLCLVQWEGRSAETEPVELVEPHYNI